MNSFAGPAIEPVSEKISHALTGLTDPLLDPVDDVLPQAAVTSIAIAIALAMAPVLVDPSISVSSFESRPERDVIKALLRRRDWSRRQPSAVDGRLGAGQG